MDIKIIKKRITEVELKQIAEDSFGDLVKGVVDINLRMMALGGELHADCESVLLANGSKQPDLWGFNIYLDSSKEDRIEFISFINIRPKNGNRSMEILDKNLRSKMKEIIDLLIE